MTAMVSFFFSGLDDLIKGHVECHLIQESAHRRKYI